MKKLSYIIAIGIISIVAFTSCKENSSPPAELPVITSVSPVTGIANTQVTITGTGFNADGLKNIVTFNGVSAMIISSSSTFLNVLAPAGGSTGDVVVTTPDGKSTGPIFTYLFPPTIASINPISGTVNTVVTFTGKNFGTTPAANTVWFNGTVATVQTATATKLTVLAPMGGTTGTVSLKTDDGSTTGPVFSYPPPPRITSINPTSGKAGTLVTITGVNFDAITENNIVMFEGVAATVISASATSLVVSVPIGGGITPVSVQTNSGTAFGPNFTYN